MRNRVYSWIYRFYTTSNQYQDYKIFFIKQGFQPLHIKSSKSNISAGKTTLLGVELHSRLLI